MNNPTNMVNELIKGIGALSELWIITYTSFKNLKLSDDDALEHTKAFMSVMLRDALNQKKEESADDQT